MSPNIFDLSNQNNSLEEKIEKNISFNLGSLYSSKDDLSRQNITRIELIEDEICQGMKSEKRGDLSTAITHYRQATKLDPESAKAYRLLSNALKKNRLKRKRSEQQNDCLQEVVLESWPKLDLSPENTEAAEQEGEGKTGDTDPVNNSADQASQIGLKPAIETSIVQSSTPDFSNVSSIVNKENHSNSPAQPTNSIVLVSNMSNMDVSSTGESILPKTLSVAQVYVEQALAFFEHKQWDKSIAACKEALRVDPDMGEAYKVWGNCLQKSGNSAEAIGIYAKALEIQPNMAEIYCNLGSIYAKGKKWQRAIEHYQKSIIIKPHSATPYRNLARVWDELGEYAKSAECFFKALEIEPKLLSAENHFDLANHLLEEGQIDRAIACYQNCIKLEPGLLNAYNRLVDALEQNGQTEEALFYYKKLAQLQTGRDGRELESKTTNKIRGFLYPSTKKSSSAIPQETTIRPLGSTPSSLISLQPAKKLKVEEQIDKYRQAAKLQPNCPSIQFELGNCYFRSRHWQKAISCYLKAIKLTPQVAKYYINLGKALEKSGNQTKASQAYYQGFSLKPKRISAQNHFLLGNKLLSQKQVKQAIACYRRAIIIKPGLMDAYWQLGVILTAIGNLDEAVACYQQALKVSPNEARSYLLLGKVLAQKKQWQPALTSYQKAANLEPDNAEIQHNLGEILAHEQQWDDAATAYRKAIALDSSNSWSHNNLGDVLLKMQRWQEASECFRTAIKLKPDFVWSHYNLGEALAELRQWDEAETAYKEAQKLQPDLPEVQTKIGAVLHHRTQQSRKEALSFYKSQIAKDPDNVDLYHQAISLDNKNHQLYLGLAKALVKQRRLDEAIVIYQTGLELQPRNIELVIGLSEILLAKNPQLGFQDIAARIVGGEGTSTVLSEETVKKSLRAGIVDYTVQLPCQDSPQVSIIIPVYNQIDYTFNCLHSIVNNVKPDLAIEVIVVNDCSTDNTKKLLEPIVGLTLVSNTDKPYLQLWEPNQTNWWLPNVKCMEEMLRACKFREVRLMQRIDTANAKTKEDRAIFNAIPENATCERLYPRTKKLMETESF
ncbi:MAG: tetratricopeptide repeat protein [Pleurocapsa sp. MO_192.B19]|nr:tetratricopeptide repeat protein [Pleurocapsa sp. MO_192.B19]